MNQKGGNRQETGRSIDNQKGRGGGGGEIKRERDRRKRNDRRRTEDTISKRVTDVGIAKIRGIEGAIRSFS